MRVCVCVCGKLNGENLRMMTTSTTESICKPIISIGNNYNSNNNNNNKENRYFEVTQMSANWATINSIIQRPLTSDRTLLSVVYECYVTKSTSPILEVFKARGWTESK